MAPPSEIQHSFDDIPGIKRRKTGTRFAYYNVDGTLIRDKAERARIQSLVIPPAWTDVWICPDPNGHILATGRDGKGRKQYIYHPDWRFWREETKFEHILKFAAALPKLRHAVSEDLKGRALDRTLVLATAVRVLERTLVRVGNAEYAAKNQSYGLTTLERRHVQNGGTKVRLQFRGKHGKTFDTSFADRRVGAILRRLEGLKGQHLLQFLGEDGEVHRLSSDDVNSYIREATEGDFTAKDFRTWAATVRATLELLGTEPATSERGMKANIKLAVAQTAQCLGNTPTVCRKSYIHPAVIEAYRDGTLAELSRVSASAGDEDGLDPQEAAVLRFLKRRLRQAKAVPDPVKEAVASAA
jgi:DNA topoisomerase-1